VQGCHVVGILFICHADRQIVRAVTFVYFRHRQRSFPLFAYSSTVT
jgi:hypothetical protein